MHLFLPFPSLFPPSHSPFFFSSLPSLFLPYLMSSNEDGCSMMMALWDSFPGRKTSLLSACVHENFQLTFFFDSFFLILWQFYLLYCWQASAISTGSIVSGIYACSWMFGNDLHASKVFISSKIFFICD